MRSPVTTCHITMCVKFAYVVGRKERVMKKVLTRKDIEGIAPGMLGFYEWGKDLPVCQVGELREVLVGPQKGKAFRYIHVQSTTSTIGFTVKEGDKFYG